nr:component of cytosolic 80S ribosome and 60S large subunit (RPL12) [Polytomella parva]|eukprot:CAMPEP_0175038742 /NCGR_PEP_ID=MMETSP0052_2-20121109/52_1 /TAXON_ID=51329 ORGANISM="Polytomella parva, Strain SAG 63-3" /NCGR_SAMPLE_ID=MMETSP0052_2 /ASSEMBLY_ACC=CAM_ASM_000194 /LENGTH=398 /DNA_ID=CAMNT_0016300227 /DNA_START=58 /DNA_END=1254 /DNA_ORIENTATION=-
MAAVRPQVSVLSVEGKPVEQIALPAVFTAPIRADVVRTIHTNLAKNKRQAYAVFNKAGHQTAAESWGTGRAVSRIPRVPGGGTHRSGQGAFGNMCRGGRMFAPTKVWRRWHRKVNVNQKRFAVASALAASAIPSLVLARGHRIEQIPEVPLVLSDEAQAVSKTSKAVEVLTKLGAIADVEKVQDSKSLRAGKGKLRNRRYVLRKGPLVIYGEDAGLTKAFRNIPGVELARVDALNLLQLAPGGHLGRFCIWTKSAFAKLDEIYASKKGFQLPTASMLNSDIARIINSDEIQSVVRKPKVNNVKHAPLKKNPLRNLGAMIKLNPYAKVARQAEITRSRENAVKRAAKLAAIAAGKPSGATKPTKEVKAIGKAFYKKAVSESEYQGEDYELFTRWLGKSQ